MCCACRCINSEQRTRYSVSQYSWRGGSRQWKLCKHIQYLGTYSWLKVKQNAITVIFCPAKVTVCSWWLHGVWPVSLGVSDIELWHCYSILQLVGCCSVFLIRCFCADHEEQHHPQNDRSEWKKKEKVVEIKRVVVYSLFSLRIRTNPLVIIMRTL